MKPTPAARARVAFVSQPFDLVYPPGGSSIPILTVHLSRELAGRGFDVTVFAPRKNVAIPDQVWDGVSYRYVSERGSGFMNRVSQRLTQLQPAERLPFHASVLSDLRYALDVAFRVRVLKADIVHVHNFTNFLPVIRWLNPSARYVLHMHCDWVSQLPREVMSRRLAISHLVVGVSHHVINEIRAAFPRTKAVLRTLFNGVDTEFYAPSAASSAPGQLGKRVLFVGRVSPEKGLHDLIDAFVRLAEHDPQIELDIVGPAGAAPREYLVDVSDDPKVKRLGQFYEEEARTGVSYIDQLKARIPESSRARVRFTGPATRESLRDYYRGAAILVNPSLTEAFGMSIAEAMACGIPTVASRVGGMVDIVRDPETGLLVDAADPDQLALALRRLLDDEALRRRMGLAARKCAVAQFSWPSLGAQLASAYENLLLRRATDAENVGDSADAKV